MTRQDTCKQNPIRTVLDALWMILQVLVYSVVHFLRTFSVFKLTDKDGLPFYKNDLCHEMSSSKECVLSPPRNKSDQDLCTQKNTFKKDCDDSLSHINEAKRVIFLETQALELLSKNIDESFGIAISLLKQVQGHIIVTGVGKSGIIAAKIASTLSATGSPAFFLHAGDACHGDLGMITKGDVVLAISNSGESQEIVHVVNYIRRSNIPLIAITQKPESTLANAAMHTLLLPSIPEACSLGLAPTTSSTATLALGDAIAISLQRSKSFSVHNFAEIHPGGSLGRYLSIAKDKTNVRRRVSAESV